MTEEFYYKLLKLLEQNPQATQCELATELEVSLDKVNCCIKTLIEKGHLKTGNFRNSDSKTAYLYLLARGVIKARAKVTVAYLQRKLEEYDSLRTEIEELQAVVDRGL